MGEKEKKAVYGLSLVMFIALMAVLTWYVGRPMIHMIEDPEAFQVWVDSFGIWGRLIFLGIVVFQVLVAFVPGEPIELAAGYIFGVVEGSLLTMGGFLFGSLLIFLLVRRFGVKMVEVFFSKERIEEVKFLKNPRKTKILAFILMMIPGTPKDFLSYFAPLTKLSLFEWLFIVLIARLPSLLTSVCTGAAAGEENYLLSAILMGITAVFSGMGILWYRRICAQEKDEKNKSHS